MPVDAFRLENFMAFEDTGWIELRKINLLLGRNSSGKSAIIRALRLMKQSLLNEEQSNQPLTFRIQGGVDLGSFDKMLHRKPRPITEKGEPDEVVDAEEDSFTLDEKRRYSEQVTFSYRGKFTLAEWSETTREILKERAESRVVISDYEEWNAAMWSAWLAILEQFEANKDEPSFFQVNASYRQDKWNKQVYLWKLEAGVSENLATEDFVPIWGHEITSVGWDSFDVYGYLNLAPGESLVLGEVFKPYRYDRFLPDLKRLTEAAVSDQNQPLEAIEIFWRVCRKEIAKWLDSIVHIGPIRPLPRRSYALTEEFRREWEIGGWQAFLDYLSRIDDARDRKVNGWLQTLKLGHEIKRDLMIKPEFEKELIAVKLRLLEIPDGDDRDLTDIGFGASQILPVIVQCLSAAPNALVLIEQPELHLHPEAQADVADMFIESVNELRDSRLELNPRQLGEEAKAAQEEEKRQPVTRRYLIETHSETIFWRLRVELAKTTAKLADKFPFHPESLCGFFVYRDAYVGNSSIGQLLFDNRGEYADSSEQFGDFFGQDAIEMDALDYYVSQIKE
jgi:hypothetical protein